MLKGVRLADFTVQRGSSTTAKGGVYLYHCFLCSLERVRSSGWYQAGEIEPHSYGFKANRGPASAGNEPPSGAILFSQCCVESSFHGIWLTGDSVARPLQRCHLFSVYLDGPVIVKGTASGGNVQNLIDVTKNFVAAEVRPGDWVFNETKGCYGKVNRILNYQQYLNARLELVNPWTGSTINGCDDGDVYSVVADLAYGVHIEKAYVSWYERYVRFHELRHPATMGAPEVEQFISHLASDGLVAASTQNPCTEPCPEPCPERSQRGSRRGGV